MSCACSSRPAAPTAQVSPPAPPAVVNGHMAARALALAPARPGCDHTLCALLVIGLVAVLLWRAI